MVKKIEGLTWEKVIGVKWIINVVLAIVIVFTSCVQSPTEVYAAKKKVTEIHFFGKPLKIETAQKFHFGDMVYVKIKNSIDYWCASEMSAKYNSSSPAIITVDKNGYARTKKPGKAVITVTCQGKKVKCPVRVVKNRAAFGISNKSMKKWRTAGDKLLKKIPASLTTENGYVMAKAIKVFANSLPQDIKVDDYGFDADGVLVASSAACYQRAEKMMNRWINKYHPCNTFPNDNLAGVYGTEDAVTVEFKKILSDKGLLAIYFNEITEQTTGLDASDHPKLNMKIDKKCYAVYTYLEDMQGGENYRAVAIFEKGSKTVTIKPTAVIKYVDGLRQEITGDDLKLQTGHTYGIYCYDLWECEVTIM